MAVQAYRRSWDDESVQYVIERTTPHPVTRGFVNRERLWQGEYRPGRYLERTDRAADLLEFRRAAHRFGVKLHRDRPFLSWSGERD